MTKTKQNKRTANNRNVPVARKTELPKVSTKMNGREAKLREAVMRKGHRTGAGGCAPNMTATLRHAIDPRVTDFHPVIPALAGKTHTCVTSSANDSEQKYCIAHPGPSMRLAQHAGQTVYGEHAGNYSTRIPASGQIFQTVKNYTLNIDANGNGMIVGTPFGNPFSAGGATAVSKTDGSFNPNFSTGLSASMFQEASPLRSDDLPTAEGYIGDRVAVCNGLRITVNATSEFLKNQKGFMYMGQTLGAPLMRGPFKVASNTNLLPTQVPSNQPRGATIDSLQGEHWNATFQFETITDDQTLVVIPNGSAIDSTAYLNSFFNDAAAPVYEAAAVFTSPIEGGFWYILMHDIDPDTDVNITISSSYTYWGSKVAPAIPLTVDTHSWECAIRCLQTEGKAASSLSFETGSTDRVVRNISREAEKDAVQKSAQSFPSWIFDNIKEVATPANFLKVAELTGML